jgi:site-specific DNA-methyltransferase (adenine-specific)
MSFTVSGRWPTNLVLVHHPDCGDECVPGCPVKEMGEQSGERKAGGIVKGSEPSRTGDNGIYGAWGRVANKPFDDTGTAARFFPCFKYQAKASKHERNLGLPEGTRNTHATVKPLELMKWLVRLVTPPGGLVLDPFLGSGTTAMACELEHFRWVGIERKKEYIDIAEQRIRWAAKKTGRIP